MGEHIRIKPDNCKACKRCEIACIAAHNNLSFKEAMKVRDAYAPRVHVVKTETVKSTVRCHQCKSAPCAKICPVGALKQDEDGKITMNEEQCVSCRMCISACPYGAITMDVMSITSENDNNDVPVCIYPKREVAVRCDMCSAWRIENGKKITACMEACPGRALYIVQEDGNIVEMPAPEKPAKAKA